MRIGIRYLIALMLLVVIMVSGCASNVPVSDMHNGNNSKEPKTQTVQAGQNDANQAKVATIKITVYRATPDAMYLVPETHQIAYNDAPAKSAVELLLAEPSSKDVVSPIPPGTALRKLVIKDHVAYVDFNDKLIKNNVGGSTSERLLVGAIVNTLTEFPEIQKVQILVDGKNIETIAGHVDLSEPLSRSTAIIKK